MIIYKIINTINDWVYIGITSKTLEERFKWHLRDCRRGVRKKLYDAIRDLGEEKFSIELVEVCTDPITLREKEEYYIQLYDSYNKGYNASSKSGGVHNHSEEAKKKMSLKKIGKKPSEKHIENQTAGIKKYWESLSVEDKVAWGLTIKGRNKGRQHSDEFKKKCSLRQTGIKRSIDTKQKMSESHKGKAKATLTCPVCGKTGGEPAMKRWHFNNCKDK